MFSSLVVCLVALGSSSISEGSAKHSERSETRVETAKAEGPASARPAPSTQVAAVSPQGFQPEQKTFGLGGRAGGFSLGMGGSMRYWSGDRIGLQVDLSRFSLGSSTDSGIVKASAELATWQVAPSVLYGFTPQAGGESVWIKPYVGGGLSLFRSSLSARASAGGEIASLANEETNVGFHGFGGAQLVFKAVPQLAISSDIGYYRGGTPFTGYHIGGTSFSVSGHWFVH